MPRLRWARKDPGHDKDRNDPETAAHLAVAFDTFESRIVPEESETPISAPFRAFGLLSFYERDYRSTPSPLWRSIIPHSGSDHACISRAGQSARAQVA